MIEETNESSTSILNQSLPPCEVEEEDQQEEQTYNPHSERKCNNKPALDNQVILANPVKPFSLSNNSLSFTTSITNLSNYNANINNNKENIKVIIRVRPRMGKEGDYKPAIKVEDNSSVTLVNTGRTFTYDHIANESINQEEMFNLTATDIAESALNGYNGTIFVYGQTGAGKTHTLMGKNPDSKISELSGVLPRTIDYIFNKITNNIDYKQSIFTIRCSFLEIYNENLFDLLVNVNSDSNNNNNNNNNSFSNNNSRQLFIRDQGDNVKVENLSEHVIKNTESALELINIGLKNRVVAPTAMNKESSRSHAVFSIFIENKSKINNKKVTKRSVFHLIDLAGSERQKNTETTGERTKEAGKINKSLMNLGHVIKALVDTSDGKKCYIHYRDSKLTHLLKDSLGGNSKTCIIANISSSHSASSETLSTLLFAQSAKLIKNKLVVNEEISNESFYKEEIRKLLHQYEGIKNENKLLQTLIRDNGLNKNMSNLNTSIGTGNLNLSINLSNLGSNYSNSNNYFNSNNNISSTNNIANLNTISSLDSLEKQLSVLVEEAGLKDTKITELVKENNFLNKRLERLDIDYKLLKMEKREEETKYDDCNNELAKLKEVYSTIAQSNYESHQLIEELKQTLEQKEQSIINESRISAEKINELSKRISVKESEINQIKQEIIILESTIKFKEEKIKQLEENILNKDILINNFDIQIKEKEIEIIELKKISSDLMNEISNNKNEFKMKETELSQKLLIKQEEINDLYFKKETLNNQNETLIKELKRYKLIIRNHNSDMSKANESKEILENKYISSHNQVLEKNREIENLKNDNILLKEKQQCLEETLDHINKDYSLLLENKNNASKMNSILNQRKEISELQKELQLKNKQISSMENFFKNISLNNNNKKNSSVEIISEIEKKNSELNNSRSIMHDIVYQVKNIIETNKESFVLSDFSKTQVEGKSLEEKFKFYIDQCLLYVKHLENKIDFNSLEMIERQKKVEELKYQIKKHSEIFKDSYLPYNNSNLNSNNISNCLSSSSFCNSNNKKNDSSMNSETLNSTVFINNENDQNSVNINSQKSYSKKNNNLINVDYEKISNELLETFINKDGNKSSILKKMNDADLIDKKTLYNTTYSMIGKKRSSKLKDEFSFIAEESYEDGTEKTCKTQSMNSTLKTNKRDNEGLNFDNNDKINKSASEFHTLPNSFNKKNKIYYTQQPFNKGNDNSLINNTSSPLKINNPFISANKK